MKYLIINTVTLMTYDELNEKYDHDANMAFDRINQQSSDNLMLVKVLDDGENKIPYIHRTLLEIFKMCITVGDNNRIDDLFDMPEYATIDIFEHYQIDYLDAEVIKLQVNDCFETNIQSSDTINTLNEFTQYIELSQL